MDPLHTLKKFGIHDGHIEGDIEPANEKRHFPEGVKPKTTCIFVAIFSCCIECYDAAFLKKLICIVQCLFYSQKSSFFDRNWRYHQRNHLTIFSKKSKLSFLKYFEEVFIKDSNLFILLLNTLFRFKRHLKFLFENVENLYVTLSQRLLFHSNSFL